MTYLPLAIAQLAPEAKWKLDDVNDLSTLEWFDDRNDRPSDEQILALAEKLAQNPPIAANRDRFLVNASQSQLYRLGKISSHPSVRVEFEEVREIINGRMLFLSEAIANGGLLQKNLRELVTALGDVPQEAIAEFNHLIKRDLGVDWTI